MSSYELEVIGVIIAAPNKRIQIDRLARRVFLTKDLLQFYIGMKFRRVRFPIGDLNVTRRFIFGHFPPKKSTADFR